VLLLDAEQIELVGGEARWRLASRDLAAQQGEMAGTAGDRVDDAADDLVLGFEHLDVGSVVPGRPYRGATARVDELGRRSDVAFVALDRTLQNEARPDLPRDGPHVHGAAAIGEHGMPPDHGEISVAREIDNQIGMQSIGETGRARVGGDRLEGQHCNHGWSGVALSVHRWSRPDQRGEPRPIVHVQFAEDVGEMGPHRGGSDEQPLADLAVGQPLRVAFGDRALARRERGEASNSVRPG
jgi:hypothetical protein